MKKNKRFHQFVITEKGYFSQKIIKNLSAKPNKKIHLPYDNGNLRQSEGNPQVIDNKELIMLED